MPQANLRDGTIINYYDSGGENRPVVIFMHGWGVDGKAFETQKNLRDKFRIIIIDVRGCGKSQTSDFSVIKVGEDIIELIAQLSLNDVHVVAWSMSAMAMWLIINQTDAITSLTTIDMSPNIDNDNGWNNGILGHRSLETDEGKLRLEKSLNAMRSDWPNFAKRMVTRIFAKSKIANSDTCTMEMRDFLLKSALENDPNNMAQLWYALSYCDARAELPKIKIPTLLIHGKDNQLYKTDLGQIVKNLIPNSQLLEFAESGHAPQIEEAQKFNQELSIFVNKHSQFAAIKAAE